MAKHITDSYLADLQQKHDECEEFGTSGNAWAFKVADVTRRNGYESLLDYGCGKNTLLEAVAKICPSVKKVTGYDPAIPSRATPPEPHEMVICTDVMEHVEIEHVDGVLADIRQLTEGQAFFVISLQTARHVLPSGRNAHITVKPAAWWLEQLKKHFGWLIIESNDGCELVVHGGR